MRKLLFYLCTLIAAAASIAPNVCRSNWYQPEEPVGLEDFYAKR